jgi:phospho-N-acetylmuramoyl-pentapeptide-transferase
MSFLIVMVLGPPLIRFLIRKKLGDRPEFDHADLNELTRHKSNTPTMGGLLIVVSIIASVLVFSDLNNMYIRMAILAVIWLGGLGAVDDWFKIKRAAGETSRDGLQSWQKILFQIGLGVLLSIYMYRYGSLQPWVSVSPDVNPAHSFYMPFMKDPIKLGILAYIIITVVTMVASSNAVNLTDGMDGLAGGCMIIVTAVFLLISWVVGNTEWSQNMNLDVVPGASEMAVLCAAIIGSCVGFLWYNAPPAQVFMGDTGSLALGGLLGYIAVVTRQEITLLIAGGVFAMEALSVILQVGYFKLTKPKGGMQGKRLFRCAPLHHHFHLGGWAESKVVLRFWIISIILAALALATLKSR